MKLNAPFVLMRDTWQYEITPLVVCVCVCIYIYIYIYIYDSMDFKKLLITI
jgi:hypothetical protein